MPTLQLSKRTSKTRLQILEITDFFYEDCFAFSREKNKVRKIRFVFDLPKTQFLLIDCLL